MRTEKVSDWAEQPWILSPLEEIDWTILETYFPRNSDIQTLIQRLRSSNNERVSVDWHGEINWESKIWVANQRLRRANAPYKFVNYFRGGTFNFCRDRRYFTQIWTLPNRLCSSEPPPS